jgi:hypothetical protein
MLRSLRLTLGLATLILGGVTLEARAQYYPGYGAWGWGGWGGGANTVQGSMARGLGAFDAELGAGREETAIANAVNEKTIQDWNQYLWLSQQQANRRAYLKRARRAQRDARSGDAIYDRVRSNPTRDDIEDGAALNVILDQLTDPRVQNSALRLATTPLDSKVIKDIPFQSATAAVAISLGQLTAQGGLPLALQGEVVGPERLEYQQAIDQALQEEDQQGAISPATLQRVNQALDRLYAKLRANPPANRADLVAAENYIRTLYGMTRLLRNPRTEKVLADLDKTPKTTLGSLLGFMHTYNLRFGEATTAAQRDIYQHLYPVMATLRDQVVKAAAQGDDSITAQANRNRQIDFFQGMSLEHLSGQGANTAPTNR